jgi:protein gp37
VDWIDRVFAVMALAPRHVFHVLTKRPRRMRQWARDPETPSRIARALLSIAVEAGFEIVDRRKGNSGRQHPGAEFFIPMPLPNVLLGVTVETRRWADERIPILLETPAAARFVSVEPMLGAIRLDQIEHGDGVINALKPDTWGEIVAACWRDTEPNWVESFLDWYGFNEMPDLVARAHPGLDWVICGGESGPGARPVNPDWVRSIRDQCAEAGTPFFFKQWGEWGPEGPDPSRDGPGLAFDCHQFMKETSPKREYAFMWRVGKRRAGRLLDGVLHDDFPRAER